MQHKGLSEGREKYVMHHSLTVHAAADDLQRHIEAVVYTNTCGMWTFAHILRVAKLMHLSVAAIILNLTPGVQQTIIKQSSEQNPGGVEIMIKGHSGWTRSAAHLLKHGRVRTIIRFERAQKGHVYKSCDMHVFYICYEIPKDRNRFLYLTAVLNITMHQTVPQLSSEECWSPCALTFAEQMS